MCVAQLQNSWISRPGFRCLRQFKQNSVISRAMVSDGRQLQNSVISRARVQMCVAVTEFSDI